MWTWKKWHHGCCWKKVRRESFSEIEIEAFVGELETREKTMFGGFISDVAKSGQI